MLGLFEDQHQIVHHNDDPRFNPRSTDEFILSSLKTEGPNWIFVTGDSSILKNKAQAALLAELNLTFLADSTQGPLPAATDPISIPISLQRHRRHPEEASMGLSQVIIMLCDVRHYADEGKRLPIRNNLGSKLTTFADAARPDALEKVYRTQIKQKVVETVSHNLRSVSGPVVGAGATVGGKFIAVAAGVGAATVGVATAGVAVAAGAVLSIGIKIGIKVYVTGKKGDIKKKMAETGAASEKELYYLLSHGQLLDLARSFEKANDTKKAYLARAAGWSAGNAGSRNCIEALDLTYLLMRWRKRLHDSLVDSPRLQALVQYGDLIQIKIAEGAEAIFQAASALLDYAARYGDGVKAVHPKEFARAALKQESFYDFVENAKEMTDDQRRGLAVVVNRTRTPALSDKILATLGELKKDIIAKSPDPSGVPLVMSKKVSEAYLTYVMANLASTGLSASQVGANAAAGGGISLALALPATMIVDVIVNFFNDKSNIEYINNITNVDLSEKVYRLRSILEKDRIKAIHKGYKTIDKDIPLIKQKVAALNGTWTDTAASVKMAEELATLMHEVTFHYTVMMSMMVFVDLMLALIHREVGDARTLYEQEMTKFSQLIEVQHIIFHTVQRCPGTCYSEANYHPLDGSPKPNIF
jgi:hypothetical protein